MATYQLLVGGVDLSAHLVQDQWSVEQNFGRQGDTATIVLEDYFASGTLSLHVPPLASVTLTDTSTGVVLFGGYVAQPAITSWQPDHLEWQLDCVSYTTLADNAIVYGIFYNQTADSIIKSLVAQANASVNAGLTTNNVQSGPAIPIVQINYLTLSDALTKISRLSSVNTDYSWFIDFSKDIHFFSLLQGTATKTVLSDSQFPGLSQQVGNYQQDSFGYEWDGTTIRNSCIVRGTTYRTRYTDVWVGNGQQRSWGVRFNVTSDVAPTLSVGGIQQTLTVITQNSQSATTAAAFSLVQSASGSWTLQVASGSTPANGSVIKLNYTAQAPIISRVDNTQSQAALNFVSQMYINDSSLSTLGTAVQRGQAELQEYQWPQERVSLTTNENFTGHINAGDLIQLQASRVPDSQKSYAQGLTGWFLVVSNSYGGVEGNYRNYTLTATRVS